MSSLPGATSFSSSISLVKTIIGAGLLSMPLAFATDGLIFGVLIILLAAVTSGYGLFLQAYVSKYIAPGHATFFNVSSITYLSLSVVFDLAIAVQCFGCALSYLVLIGDIAPTIFPNFTWVEESYHRTFWIIVSTSICVPLSFLKNLDSLKYTSVLGLLAILYLSLLVVTHYLVGDIPLEGNLTYFPPNASGVFSTFSIIVFAFTGHQNMFSIINEAQNKSLISLTKLVQTGILTSSALFIIVGLAGYLTFGDSVSGNVILNYPHSLPTRFGRIAIVFMTIFSFPLMLHPARISVNNIYFYFTQRNNVDENTPLIEDEQGPIRKSLVVPLTNKTFIVITTLLLVAAYWLAVTIESFAFVLAIVGATGSTAISFILPGLFGYKLIGSESDDPLKVEKLLKWLSLILVIWGVAVMVVCLTVSLTQ